MKSKKTIDRQEQFAQDNYDGIQDMVKELHQLIKQDDKNFKEYVKLDNAGRDTSEIKAVIQDNTSQIETILTVLSIKLTNTVGHALTAKSTKMIKKVVKFMDKYSISDKPIHSSIIRTVSNRFGNGGLYEMALIAASINGDFDFVKEIFEMAEKNKTRKNILEDVHGLDYTFSGYGNMSSMSRIDSIDRIAFEAMVSGHKEIYEFLNSKQELKVSTIENFITPDFGRTTLSDTEVMNLVEIRPEFLDYILENAEELLPETVKSVFIF